MPSGNGLALLLAYKRGTILPDSIVRREGAACFGTGGDCYTQAGVITSQAMEH